MSTAMAWERGFDILTVGKIGKNNILFAYDRDTGRAYKYYLTSDGIGKRQSDKVFKWRKSWTHLDLRGETRLRMFHSGTTGDVQLYQLKQNIGKDKKTKKIKTYKNFYKGFDIVEVINTASLPHYLFYDKDKGYAKIYAYNGVDHNFGAPVYKSKSWHQGWDIIKQWHLGNNGYLLLYDREIGKLRINKVKTSYPKDIGEQTYESSEWSRTWHSITTYSKSDNTYALFYDKTNGVGKVFKLDYKTGTIKSLIKEYTGWRKSWDIVTTYTINDELYILFYDKHKGGTNVYKIGAGGLLTERIQSK
jgi:hypothetical protein